MNKNQKSDLVSIIREKLINSAFVSIIHYRGMSDKQLYDMRVALKAKDCSMKIAKNTLIRVAIKGTDLESLAPHLKGPTAILYSQDVVALSKTISDFSKQVEAIKIKVGFFNKSLVSESSIMEMAKLGSLNDVRASFIGMLKGSQSNFVRILLAPQEGLATLKQ
jgi:large subunit ribosomal protein L10